MSSTIQGDVLELKSLKEEVKKHLAHLKYLRQKINQTQSRIDKYLDAKNQNGVKYKGYAVYRNPKPTRRRKKKQEQQNDAISVLQKYNIDDPKGVLKEIMEARRGSPQMNRKLVLKKYKEKH